MRNSLFKHVAALAVITAFLAGCAEKPNPAATPEAEAGRLYERADAFVKSVAEGKYSYNYIQFYWRRAQANIERIKRSYSETPTARQLSNGELKLGPYELGYFHDRVLPRLEVKKLASFNAVNCAIFLYNLPENKENTPARRETLRWIGEYLSRAKRFNEILAFPVADEDRPLMLATVARVATTYNEDKLVAQLLREVTESEGKLLIPIIAEAHAFRGDKLEQLEKSLADNGDSPELRLAVLRGLVRRENTIARTLAENLPIKSSYDGVDGIQKPDVRIDIEAFAKAKFNPLTPGAEKVLATYHHRSEPATNPLQKIYDLARLGQIDAARTAQADLAQQQPKLAERGAYEIVRGQINSFVVPFVVQPDTFSSLSLKDPNLLAQLILEWSLTPNRNQRGMLPWDLIAFRFAPGFENLPLPEVDTSKGKTS